MKPNLKEHPLRIVALLGQTSFDRTLALISLLSAWSGWMGALEITLDIYVRQNAERLQPLCSGFDCPVSIRTDTDGAITGSFHCEMTKPVFGVERQIVFNSMRLECGKEVLFEAKRVNRSALDSCIRKALRVQYLWLSERITKFVDSKIVD